MAERREGFGSAPGKVILFGEHAVVYGQPAIAVPLADVRAQVRVTSAPVGSGTSVAALDLPVDTSTGGGLRSRLEDLAEGHPLRQMVQMAIQAFGRQGQRYPDVLVQVMSDIPIGRGLGSGAAVGTAIVRAVADYYGQCPGAEEVSGLVFEMEKCFHGTPSGIDNTVVAHEMPLYFVQGSAPVSLSVSDPVYLVVGDAGPASPTREVVAFVRQKWQDAPSAYNLLFTQIGDICRLARRSLETGDMAVLGGLMRRNHELLGTMGVSSPELDRLVEVAEAAGALGAKMSGAGWGGNMVALVQAGTAALVAAQLRQSGAESVILSVVKRRA